MNHCGQETCVKTSAVCSHMNYPIYMKRNYIQPIITKPSVRRMEMSGRRWSSKHPATMRAKFYADVSLTAAISC